METMKTVTDFIFLGSKITVDGDLSHEIKGCLLLERKAMTNLDIILKSRDIMLLTKVCLIMVFPIVMYGCKSQIIKKTEIIASSLFTSWQIDGKTLETAADYFGGLGNHCR